MKIFSYLLLLVPFVFSSCAVTTVESVPVHKIVTKKKTPDFVELLLLKPKRKAICIGLIGTSGNGFASHEDSVQEARKKAALLGADFIMKVDAGTDTTTHVNPGYSTYQSNGSAYLNGNNGSIYGSAAQNASAYSVGPSLTTINRPWGVFSAWVYRPSTDGIDFDDNNIVTGFRLQSTAENAGMKIGDTIVGVDGFDIKDESLAQHLMEILPGDSMSYVVSRDGKRITIYVTAISN